MKIVDPKYRKRLLQVSPIYHLLTIFSILAVAYFPEKSLTFIQWNYLWVVPAVLCLFLPFSSQSTIPRHKTSTWYCSILGIVLGNILLFWAFYWSFWTLSDNTVPTKILAQDFFYRMTFPQGLYPWVLWSLLTVVLSTYFARKKEPRYVDVCSPALGSLRHNLVVVGCVQGTVGFSSIFFFVLFISIFASAVALLMLNAFHVPFSKNMTLSAFGILLVLMSIPSIKILKKFFRTLTNRKLPLGYFYFGLTAAVIILLGLLNALFYGISLMMPPTPDAVQPPAVLYNSPADIKLSYDMMYWAWQFTWVPIAATFTAKYSYDRSPRTILFTTLAIPCIFLVIAHYGAEQLFVPLFTHGGIVLALMGFAAFCIPMGLMRASGFDMTNFLLTEKPQRFRPNQYMWIMTSLTLAFTATLITFGFYPLRLIAVCPTLALTVLMLIFLISLVIFVLRKP